MPIKPKTLRIATGMALAASTLCTRLPFRGRTLFEFDSVDFAVATFRFNIDQVTPHVPGDILHVLATRLLAYTTSDINSAFVWLSILLSVGSVLFVWRAGAQFRGERVGLVTALLWLTNPLFWFTGCVSTAYIHEAFFCSALLYAGISWIRRPSSGLLPIVFAATLAVAIGARQNDVLFFAPAVIWLFVKLRPQRKIWLASLFVFLVLTAAWLAELLIESGGLHTYLAAFARERGFKSQSILFGSSWHDQLNTTLKFLFYLPIAVGPALIILLTSIFGWPRRSLSLLRDFLGSRVGRFMVLLLAPSSLFYLAIYFMKAGYLLTLAPVITLALAALLDMIAIWLAERAKRKSSDKLRLTRPIITNYAIILTGIAILLNVLWFALPLPGTSNDVAFDELTRESFARGASSRLSSSTSRWLTIGNRIFSKTNFHGITSTDAMNHLVDSALLAAGADDPHSIVIASWWDRQAYLALRHAYVYDIQPMGDTIAVGVQHDLWRTPLDAKQIELPAHQRVFLLMRHDHPDFNAVSEQLQLRRIDLPEYLDVYEVVRIPDTLAWRNARFITARSGVTD